jgi:hypothetical protein
VSNVQLILWERPPNVKHGGWKNRGTRHPKGGFTPYDSGWRQALPCYSGYTIHYEMKADVITPDGGGARELEQLQRAVPIDLQLLAGASPYIK